MVDGGVAACVPGPQLHRERLAGPVGAVVQERPQRVMPEAALERRAGVLLVGVARHECRVDIDDQRRLRVRLVIRRGRTGELPGTWARAAARAPLIAASALGASTASASMVRETVGSDATGP